MKRIAVFCGSSYGFDNVYQQQAFALGQYLAENKMTLVYGGAKVGLMGAVADGALNKGGTVIGILPHFLKSKEVAHEGLTELILVETMHERKIKMYELSDGVIALPGGFGTMEEFFEMLTWGQLGLHTKPMALFNVNGFYDSLLSLADHMVEKGFLKNYTRHILLASSELEDLFEQMRSYTSPDTGKWITKETT
jgi:uncharacterized protein (TIGR00730 family)